VTTIDQPGRATVADVAAHANVSTRTVSRALSDPGSVTTHTRRRVEAAVRATGYLRMDGASRRESIADLAVVALHSADAVILRGILRGVGAGALTLGYRVSHSDVVATEVEVRAALERAIETKAREGAAGIIVVATEVVANDVARAFAAELPVVLVLAKDDEVASVAIDSYNGAVQATRHLIALGHTRLAHLGGPPHLVHSRDRLRGFTDTLNEAGLEPVTITTGDWSAESGRAGGRILMDLGATAVFCASDQIALGLMHAYSGAGKGSPEGISVVGYDDEPGAAYFLPPLTTIRQDYGRVGYEAVSAIDKLSALGRRTHTELVPELIVRHSARRLEP
jgi:DNA-binding LacI/PurR family transcriptional regulator